MYVCMCVCVCVYFSKIKTRVLRRLAVETVSHELYFYTLRAKAYFICV